MYLEQQKKKHERCVQIFLYITKTRGRQMFFINHTQTPSTNSPDYIYIYIYIYLTILGNIISQFSCLCLTTIQFDRRLNDINRILHGIMNHIIVSFTKCSSLG